MFPHEIVGLGYVCAEGFSSHDVVSILIVVHVLLFVFYYMVVVLCLLVDLILHPILSWILSECDGISWPATVMKYLTADALT